MGMEHALNELRASLLENDLRLIAILVDRQKIVSEIGRVKVAAKLSTVQPHSFEVMQHKRETFATEMGVPVELIRTLFDEIHAYSVSQQEQQK